MPLLPRIQLNVFTSLYDVLRCYRRQAFHKLLLIEVAHFCFVLITARIQGVISRELEPLFLLSKHHC